MKNPNEVDYNSKILNFMAMTETGNPEEASKYLEAANWDETIAVNNFLNKIKANSNQNRVDKNNEEPINNDYNSINIINENNMNQNLIEKNQNDEDNEEECNCIMSTIKNIFGSCFKKEEICTEDVSVIFNELPNTIKDLNKFIREIKKNVGIIILYKHNNAPFLKRFIRQITMNDMSMTLLKNNCIIIPISSNSKEEIRIKNIIKENQLLYPAFIFFYVTNKNNINKLEGESFALDDFHSILIDSVEKLNNYKTSLQSNPNNYSGLTDAEVLEKQREEMEALEKEVQNNEKKIREQKLMEEQKKIEEEEQKKKEEKKLEELKKMVVEEPPEGDPNATTICFRYPDGENRKNRRFLKSHTIQNLYDYIASLGKEIYTEEENNSFSLYQPFPPKKYEDYNNTLENEGLFPNAIIQIKEE